MVTRHTSSTELAVGGKGGGCRLWKLVWEDCRRGMGVQWRCWQVWLNDAKLHPIPIDSLHKGFPNISSLAQVAGRHIPFYVD